jgi:hypothetical protein
MSGFKLSEDLSNNASTKAPATLRADQPLGLTVHSMPALDQVSANASQRTSLGRWKMILVFLVCAAPVVASYLTYYFIRPEGRRNFGELINPQRSLPDVSAVNLDGQPQKLAMLKGQWLLVSVGSGQCLEACVQQLYLQRQLREVLGREKDRVDRVWLISDDLPVPDALRPGLKEATLLRMPLTQIAQWLAPAPGHGLSEHLYVVDPMGNWMMRFPANLDAASASKAKKDLERLLRASSSWDEPGRLIKPASP